MSNDESHTTLSVIALALLIGYYLFKTEVLLHIVLLLLCLIAFPNRLSRILARSWLRFGEALGRVNAKIILTVIYIVVLVPVSFCYRRLNRNAVEYYDGRNLDSFFKDSGNVYTGDFFEKTW